MPHGKLRDFLGLPSDHRPNKPKPPDIDQQLAEAVAKLSEAPGVAPVRRRNRQPVELPPPPPVPLLPAEGLVSAQVRRDLPVPEDRSHVESDKELARAILRERRRLEIKDEVSTGWPVGVDPYFKSDKVLSLNVFNFDEFIKNYEKTIVMFFHPGKSESFFPSREFANAAMGSKNYKHAYAAVDCSVDRELCCKQKITDIPTLRLFSNGYQVGSVGVANAFTAHQISTFVTMSPVLTQPRSDPNSRKS